MRTLLAASTITALAAGLFWVSLGCDVPAGREGSGFVARPGPVVPGDILKNGKKLYSQYDEELVIRDFFRDHRGGFFVDVGCAWPIRLSTTYYLEKHLGWSGIGIDALAYYRRAWQRERPRSRFFQFLVTDHHGTRDAFFRTFEPGLSSIHEERELGDLKLRGHKMDVPTMTLDKLLDDLGIEQIDLLSVDIEESEPAALAGFDIRRFRPELVCIEASTLPVRKEIRRYFRLNGYEWIREYLQYDSINWYFRPRSTAPAPTRRSPATPD